MNGVPSEPLGKQPSKGSPEDSKGESPPAMPLLEVGLNRCPFCHEDVVVEHPGWVACSGCLARHHRPCWTESHACAACGKSEALTRGDLPRSRLAIAIGSAALVLVGVMGVVTLARNEAVPPADTIAAGELPISSSKPVTRIPDWVRLLRDPNPEVRRKAIYSDGIRITESSIAVPALIEALGDSDWYVRMNAAGDLGAFRSDAQEAVPSLVACLRDENELVRSAAAAALADLGPVAKAAVPEMTNYLYSYPAEGEVATRFLGAVGNDECVSILLEVAASGGRSGEARKGAMQALYKCAPRSEKAILAMAAALDDSSAEVRNWAFYSLKQAGKDAAPAVPAILARFRSEDDFIRMDAASTLGAIGVSTPEVIERLERVAVKDSNSKVRELAKEALEALR